METTLVRDWHDLPAALRGATVALGNFDGVHLGHAAVLRAAHAARPDLPLAATPVWEALGLHWQPEPDRAGSDAEAVAGSA